MNLPIVTHSFSNNSAGIPDFRSENGLYQSLKERFNLDDPTAMFDLKYFINDPSLFSSFGGEICPGFGDKIKYYPTPSHYFIKVLESKGKLLRNYTQNIDTLEIRAGISNFITCHGSYEYASCISCGFQVNGFQIESHIFEQRVPLCPHCCPNKSDLKHLLNSNNGSSKLRKHKPIISINAQGDILKIRLHKILCSMKYLQKGCPILFSFDDDTLQKAVFDADELYSDEKDEDEIDMNFRYLMLRSSDSEILRICKDAIMQWLTRDIASFGVIKPDIVFFHESLSANYHNTLESDMKKCDLLLVMGTSLKVEPVSSIPSKLLADVPAVLINRECVGYPNEFDVNLLGNCDDICCSLIYKLKWDLIGPQKREKQKENDEDVEMKEVKMGQTIKPIDTVKVDAKLVESKFYQPNYYLFPNGKVPEDMVVDD